MNTKINLVIIVMMLITIAIPISGHQLNKDVDDSTVQPTNQNNPPNPPTINGLTSGRATTLYEYEFTLTDPDLDDYMLFLEIDFGEEDNETVGIDCNDSPWYNGTTVAVDHSWSEEGEYEIRARTVDSYGDWSDWSNPYQVSMPKHKVNNIDLLTMMKDRFPIIYQILTSM